VDNMEYAISLVKKNFLIKTFQDSGTKSVEYFCLIKKVYPERFKKNEDRLIRPGPEIAFFKIWYCLQGDKHMVQFNNQRVK